MAKYKGSRRDRQLTPSQRNRRDQAWWNPFTGDRHEDLVTSWSRA